MIYGIDLVSTQSPSGSKTYINGLIKLIGDLTQNYTVCIFIDNETKIKNLKKNKRIIISKIPSFFSNGLYRILWTQIIFPFYIYYYGIKKVFCPLNICPLIFFFSKVKIILSVHSLLPWTHFNLMPGNNIKKLFIKLFMQFSIKVCDTLICPSSYTKIFLKKKLNLKKDKVLVLNHYIENFNKKKCEKKFIKDFDYKSTFFLSVLSCARYHNIINLLKAFKLTNVKENNIKFLLVMSILDNKYFLEINRFIKKNNIRNLKIVKNLHRDYLYNLYRFSKGYVFSSYSETFGYTSLEAMSLGSPVIVSKTSALPEVNKNGAIYFNPNNVYQISKLMKKIVSDKKLRKKLIRNGKLQSNKYTINTYRKKMLDILL